MTEETFLIAADLRKEIYKIDNIIDKLEILVYGPPIRSSYLLQINDHTKFSVSTGGLEVLLKYYEDEKQKLEEKFKNL